MVPPSLARRDREILNLNVARGGGQGVCVCVYNTHERQHTSVLELHMNDLIQ